MGVNMKTEMITMTEDAPDTKGLRRAGDIIKSGGLVAFPTETVYGLGGNALDGSASKKIYAAKGRPSDNPLIVHIANMDDLYKVAAEVPKKARILAEAFWPGPLTMILNKTPEVPLETTGGLETVAVRFPVHKIARALIEYAGGFVAAPSANSSGRPSPTLAGHVAEDLDGKIEMIIDGGSCDIGLESTIVDFTEGTPSILRPGYYSKEMIAEVIGEVIVDPGILTKDSNIRPKAPGMRYRHYAPKAPLTIVEGGKEKVIARINALVKTESEAGRTVGILCTDETFDAYEGGYRLSIGARRDERQIAAHLYLVLRSFDERGVSCIYSESLHTPKMGQAIMNRLLKAAGHEVIKA